MAGDGAEGRSEGELIARLRELRDKRDLTNLAIAKELGVSTRTLDRLIRKAGLSRETGGRMHRRGGTPPKLAKSGAGQPGDFASPDFANPLRHGSVAKSGEVEFATPGSGRQNKDRDDFATSRPTVANSGKPDFANPDFANPDFATPPKPTLRGVIGLAALWVAAGLLLGAFAGMVWLYLFLYRSGAELIGDLLPVTGPVVIRAALTGGVAWLLWRFVPARTRWYDPEDRAAIAHSARWVFRSWWDRPGRRWGG